MKILKALLGRGFFPSELPPPFTTAKFAELMHEEYSRLPVQFSNPDRTGKVSTHNRPRVGSLRRTLGLPNPIHQFRLSDEIEKNWKTLDSHFKKSKLTLSRPVPKIRSDRALPSRYPMSALPIHRASGRAVAKYIVTTDITRFYHSIYTHSIPWALHTKPLAKKKKSDDRLLGNRLDKYTRSGQDNQTVGVPIGPDTSLVIAEIILCKIDSELSPVLRRNGFRYIDDYELGFHTLSQAEDALGDLEEKLGRYELALNPRKTRILRLPVSLEDAWAPELRAAVVSDDSKPKAQEYSLLRYFDRAFELTKQYPDEHVLNYAIQRASSVLIAKRNWKLYEDLMLQCILSEPGTLRFAFAQLTRYEQTGYTVDRKRIERVVNSLIEIHSRQGHGNEVAWALWAAIYFDVRITKSNAKRAGKMDDSVVALLALDGRKRGVIDSDVDFHLWESSMTTASLYDTQWLLSYEANIKRWLPSVGRSDHVGRDACFNYLKRNGVYFYDETVVDRMREKERPATAAFISLPSVFMQYP